MVKKALNLDRQIQTKFFTFTNGKTYKQRKFQKWMYAIGEDIYKKKFTGT